MKHSKRTSVLALLLVLLLCVGLLAGCGGETPGTTTTRASEPSQTETTPAPATEATTEPTTAAVGPLEATPTEKTVGDYTLKAAWIPFDRMVETGYPKDIDADYADGILYLLNNRAKTLTAYKIDGGKAVQQTKTDLNASFEKVSINHEGKPVLSKGVGTAVILEPDGTFTDTGIRYDLAGSKKKDFTITTWTNADTVKIEKGQAEPWILTNLKDDATRTGDFTMIFNHHIVGDHIFIAGNALNAEGKRPNTVIAYDLSGKEVFRTREVTPGNGDDCQTETKNGVVAVCTNNLSLWNMDGTMIGNISDCDAFFGVDASVWNREVLKRDDGSILLVTVASKADNTSEVLLFSVEGF